MTPCGPDCPVCGGMGFVRRPYTSIHDPNFGKLDPCPEGLKTTWDTLLGIEEAESQFLDWSRFKRSQAMILMQSTLTDLLILGYGWLYLWGEPGLGKTVAAKTAAIEARYKFNKQARYLTHSGMINFLRSSYDEENGQSAYTRRLDSLVSLDLLIIDEVGRDRHTDFGISAFSDLLDRRYVSAITQRSITVFVSNFPPAKVLDAYQLDRVLDTRFKVIQLQGSSMRLALLENKKISNTEVPWWQNLQ